MKATYSGIQARVCAVSCFSTFSDDVSRKSRNLDSGVRFSESAMSIFSEWYGLKGISKNNGISAKNNGISMKCVKGS